MVAKQSITTVLIDGLITNKVEHVFGIPGDYALGLFDAITHSKIKLINTCDEQGAGFAADAYARVKGMGAVCVTYGVGGLKLINSTAQAYAERSPVVVISGAPGISEQSSNALLHHRVRDFDSQIRIFREITTAQAVLNNPQIAAQEIQRVLATAQRTKRPVYIEIPRDCVAEHTEVTPQYTEFTTPPDPATLAEALQEVLAILDDAKHPVILAGIEIHRFQLQEQLRAFIKKTGYPFATTIMGKSLLNEKTPGFLGVYSGGLSRPEVQEVVEDSDCVLLLGAMLTDVDTGIFTANLDPAKMIAATAENLTIHRHSYPGLNLPTLLEALLGAKITQIKIPLKNPIATSPPPFKPKSNTQITIARLFECLNTKLDDTMAIIADPGDALFAATDLTIHAGAEFFACAYYASLGFAVPGSIGLQLAAPARRPIVLVGDGAFQMTGMELSTTIRYQLTPVVIVLDNSGYGTERPMLDGPFNDVQPWNVAALPQVINGGESHVVENEAQFDAALQTALADKGHMHLIHVRIEMDDISPALRRLTSNLKKRV